MRRSLADAILKEFEDKKRFLSDDLPNATKVPLLVDFTLGDLRSLERGIKSVDSMKMQTTNA